MTSKNDDILTVGPFPDCNYQTDGVDDAVQVLQALAAITANGCVIGYGDLYIDPVNPIILDGAAYQDPNYWDVTGFAGKTFTGPTTSPRNLRLHLTGTAAGDLIKVDGNNGVIKNMTLDGNRIDENQATVVQSGSNGIEFTSVKGGVGAVLQNLIISDCGYAGIAKLNINAASNLLGYTNWRDIWINKCAYGLRMSSGGDIIINNMTISNPYYDCVHLDYTAGYMQFIGGHWWEGGNGVLDEPTRQAIFAANSNIATICGYGHNIFHNVIFDTWNDFALVLWSDGTQGNFNGNGNQVIGCGFMGATKPGGLCVYIHGFRNVVDACTYTYDGSIVVACGIYADNISQYNVITGNPMDHVTTPVYCAGLYNTNEHNGD